MDDERHWFDDDDDYDDEYCYDCNKDIYRCTCYCPQCGRERVNDDCLCHAVPKELRLPDGA